MTFEPREEHRGSQRRWWTRLSINMRCTQGEGLTHGTCSVLKVCYWFCNKDDIYIAVRFTIRFAIGFAIGSTIRFAMKLAIRFAIGSAIASALRSAIGPAIGFAIFPRDTLRTPGRAGSLQETLRLLEHSSSRTTGPPRLCSRPQWAFADPYGSSAAPWLSLRLFPVSASRL